MSSNAESKSSKDDDLLSSTAGQAMSVKQKEIFAGVVFQSNEMDMDSTEFVVFSAKQLIKEESFKLKDIAKVLKEKCEKKFGGSWHCIVGSHFGFFGTNERGRCL